jgi:hypothetical protein
MGKAAALPARRPQCAAHPAAEQQTQHSRRADEPARGDLATERDAVDPTSFARSLSASAMAVMGLGLAFVLVYGRLSAISRRRLPFAPPRPLTQAELDGLRHWQRRTLRWFVGTMGLLVAFGVLSALARWIPPWGTLAAQAALLCIAAAGLAVHFSGRCPLCGRRIGFQSSLVLPTACEICGAVFRPDAPLVTSIPANGVHVVSGVRILGWPLFAVAIGGDPAMGGTRGIARGVIAVGDVAIGAVAVGGVAAGGIAVGGVSVGLLSVGGVAIGVAAVGGLAAGGLALGGLAIGVHAIGGLALGRGTSLP